MTGAQPPQSIRFCRAPDGTRIAYAVHGHGPPLLVSTCWLSHLQHDWESPVWQHFLRDLGRIATVVRYDERGHGLSDRDVTDFSLEARVGDLEAVADDAGFDRFALMAMAQGGPPSIHYAARHPDRLTRLIFYVSTACLVPDPTPRDRELRGGREQMIKVGYGREDSTFRRVFTSMMIPDSTEEQMRWLDDLTGSRLGRARVTPSGRARLGGRPSAARRPRPADPRDARAGGEDPHVRPGPPARGAHRRLAVRRARQPQPHRARRRAGLAGRRRTRSSSSSRRTGERPVGGRRHAVGAGARGPRAGRRRSRQRRDRARLHLSVRTVERHLQNSYTKLGRQRPLGACRCGLRQLLSAR